MQNKKIQSKSNNTMNRKRSKKPLTKHEGMEWNDSEQKYVRKQVHKPALDKAKFKKAPKHIASNKYNP